MRRKSCTVASYERHGSRVKLRTMARFANYSPEPSRHIREASWIFRDLKQTAQVFGYSRLGLAIVLPVHRHYGSPA